MLGQGFCAHVILSDRCLAKADRCLAKADSLHSCGIEVCASTEWHTSRPLGCCGITD
jgi:hypothetical protein